MATEASEVEALPCEVDAEAAFLGSMLLNPDAVLDDWASRVKPDDFMLEYHAAIYREALNLYNDGKRPDVRLLAPKLGKSTRNAPDGGWVPLLATLVHDTPHAVNAGHYAKLVIDAATRRALMFAGSEIEQIGRHGGESAPELLAAAERRLFSILDDRRANEAMPIGDVLTEVFAEMEARQKGQRRDGVTTGFKDLDAVLGCLRNGELIILAARPGGGKSSLAMNIAERVGVDSRHAVVFISLEMSKLELASRAMFARSRVNSHKANAGFLTAGEREDLVRAGSELGSAPIFIDAEPGQTVTGIGATGRRWKRKHDLRLLIVDYLQLIVPDDRRVKREEQVAAMTRRLKLMARELNIPILVLCQLNREVEKMADKRPRLSHLRESGAIEQDADVVMFVYLDEGRAVDPNRPGNGGVIVAKQRNGPTGEVRLTWSKDFTRFDDPARTSGWQAYDPSQDGF